MATQQPRPDQDERLRLAVHDLKEPLNSARGFLEVVASRSSGALDEETQGCLDDARASLDRMQALVQGILDAAPHLAEAPLVDRVQAALTDLHALVHQEDGTVETDLARAADRAVPLPVGRVIQNLVANALRHGGVPPHVRIAVVEREEGLVVCVDDNGKMIADQAGQAMFEPDPHAVGKGGHGLGLTSCRRLVEAWGGRIWLERSPMGGNRFAFTLPP